MSPPRLFFLFEGSILKNRLPTKDNLQKKDAIKGGQALKCPLCLDEVQSCLHFFFACPRDDLV